MHQLFNKRTGSKGRNPPKLSFYRICWDKESTDYVIGTMKVAMVWGEGKSERTEKGHSGKCRGSRNGHGENGRRITDRYKMQNWE